MQLFILEVVELSQFVAHTVFEVLCDFLKDTCLLVWSFQLAVKDSMNDNQF